MLFQDTLESDQAIFLKSRPCGRFQPFLWRQNRLYFFFFYEKLDPLHPWLWQQNRYFKPNHDFFFLSLTVTKWLPEQEHRKESPKGKLEDGGTRIYSSRRKQSRSWDKNGWNRHWFTLMESRLERCFSLDSCSICQNKQFKDVNLNHEAARTFLTMFWHFMDR